MRKRSVEILLSLLRNETDPITITGLSKLYDVSERTLHNDIHLINGFLKESGMEPVAVGADGALAFVGPVDKKGLISRISGADTYSYHMQRNERDDIILAVLLTYDGYITSDELADILSFSRPTVVKDIARLRKERLSGELSLQSVVGVGMRLKYDERVFRKELLRIVRDNFTLVSRSQGAFQNILSKTLNFEITLDAVAKHASSCEQKLLLQFTDVGFVQLVCYLYVALNRIRKGCAITPGENADGVKEDMVTAMMSGVAERLGMPVPESELREIERVAREWPLMPPQLLNEHYILLRRKVAEYARQLSRAFNRNLLQDESLCDFLVQYLHEYSQGEVTDTAEQSELIASIQTQYASAYQLCSENAKLLCDGTGLQLQPRDLAHITMHVLAAMERTSYYRSSLQVIVACPGSMATGQFLVSQLRKHFSFRVKGVCSVRNLFSDDGLEDVDLIIATTPVWHENPPVVTVNPLLQLSDIMHIQEMAFKVLQEKRGRKEPVDQGDETPSDPLARLRDLIDRQTSTERRNELLDEVEALANRLSKEPTERKRRFCQLATPVFLQCVDGVENWRAALRMAGAPLVEGGRISAEYIDSTIRNCEENGPYFVLGNGLAIAHTNARDGLLDEAISLLLIREGVSFGHKTYGSVRLLFFVCLKSPNNEVLKLLMDCAKDGPFVDKLFRAETGREMYALFQAYEHRYEGKECGNDQQ